MLAQLFILTRHWWMAGTLGNASRCAPSAAQLGHDRQNLGPGDDASARR